MLRINDLAQTLSQHNISVKFSSVSTELKNFCILCRISETRTMTKDTEVVIEKISVAFSKAGFQPAMGRIYGYLMVAEPPQKTFEEIQKDLKLSKSAVSNALNMLLAVKTVDYTTHTGDRKRYFYLNTEGWIAKMKERMQTNFFNEIIQDALDIRSEKYPEFNQKLADILEFHAFVHKETMAAIEKWERQRGK